MFCGGDGLANEARGPGLFLLLLEWTLPAFGVEFWSLAKHRVQ
jgi:hypothetical protein